MDCNCECEKRISIKKRQVDQSLTSEAPTPYNVFATGNGVCITCQKVLKNSKNWKN